MRAVVFVSTVQNPEETLICSDNRSLDNIAENEIINDFDLIAVEKAIQLKETGIVDEIVIFSLAPSRNHLLKLLAMGADKAIWGEARNADLTPQKVVQTAIQNIPNDTDTIWMLGKMGVNFESHLTAQLFAQSLNIPCLCSCFALEFKNGKYLADCEEDGGTAHYQLAAPFVVTSELRLAEPRFPSLPNIIKAKKKPVQQIEMDSNHLSNPTESLSLNAQKKRECRMITPEEFSNELFAAIKDNA